MGKYINKGQIIAGSILLGFDWVDEDSINLLSSIFTKEHPQQSYMPSIPKEYYKYIYHQGNKYFFHRKLEEKASELKLAELELFNLVGPEVAAFYQNLNMEGFLLNKIFKLGESYLSGNEDLLFSKFEQEYIQRLKENGCLEVNSSGTENAYETQMTFTDNGRLALFKYLNKEELDMFKEKLRAKGINSNVLDQYLISKNLLVSCATGDTENIISIESLEDYCKAHGLKLYVHDINKIDFTKLNLNRNGNNDHDKISNLFTIFDDGHSIYICHPNHIFRENSIINKETHDITSINWDDIDPSKMLEKGNCKQFIMSDPAWKYTIKRLSNMIKKHKGVSLSKANGHLAVVEKYTFEYEDNYIVRGIVKGDQQSLYIAFNPEYEESIPKSTFEKGLRYSGRETPKLYLKSRKGSKN